MTAESMVKLIREQGKFCREQGNENAVNLNKNEANKYGVNLLTSYRTLTARADDKMPWPLTNVVCTRHTYCTPGNKTPRDHVMPGARAFRLQSNDLYILLVWQRRITGTPVQAAASETPVFFAACPADVPA